MSSAPVLSGSVLAHWSSVFTYRRVQICGATSGLDLAFITDDGQKIERIVGFFGPLKPLSE